jgi:hypothetical protein
VLGIEAAMQCLTQTMQLQWRVRIRGVQGGSAHGTSLALSHSMYKGGGVMEQLTMMRRMRMLQLM